MALIKCPECGKEISSFAVVCIYCGYPIADMNKVTNKPVQNNTLEIFSKCPICKTEKENMKICPVCGYKKDDLIPNRSEILQSIEQQQKESRKKYDDELKNRPATCPKCGSTQFTTMQRGHSLIFSWLGSGDPQNVCQRCGYTWKPGRDW